MIRFATSRPSLSLTLAVGIALVTPTLPAAAQLATWEPVLVGATGGLFPDGTIDSPFRIAVDPADAATLYMTTGVIPTPGQQPPPADGLWKTTDGGASWSQINEASTGDPGLDFFELTPATSVLDLAVCPADPAVLAVAANPKGIFRSEDGGATWAWVAAGIVHTSADADHCGAISHGDQTFDTVGERWAATAVAFDAADCSVMYVGVADINAIDIGGGTGDHPGVFRSSDAGASWTELNGNLRPRVDAIDCHPLSLRSKTIAPIDLAPTPSGDLLLVTTEQDVDARILASKSATSQLRVWENPAGAGSWTERSAGLESSRITQTAGIFDLTAISVSAGFLTVGPGGSFYAASHIGLTTEILLDGSDNSLSKSRGIFASLDLANWFPRDSGLPQVTDAGNLNAQNVGPVSVNPARNSIWVVGTSLSDSAGEDTSQVWVTADFGGFWLNTAAAGFFAGLSTSPAGFTESNVTFVEWDSAGGCLYATVLWNLAAGTSTVDDGLYRACVL